MSRIAFVLSSDSPWHHNLDVLAKYFDVPSYAVILEDKIPLANIFTQPEDIDLIFTLSADPLQPFSVQKFLHKGREVWGLVPSESKESLAKSYIKSLEEIFTEYGRAANLYDAIDSESHAEQLANAKRHLSNILTEDFKFELNPSAFQRIYSIIAPIANSDIVLYWLAVGNLLRELGREGTPSLIANYHVGAEKNFGDLSGEKSPRRGVWPYIWEQSTPEQEALQEYFSDIIRLDEKNGSLPKVWRGMSERKDISSVLEAIQQELTPGQYRIFSEGFRKELTP